MSPELLDPDQFGFKNGRPTKESDCYALGMVILEVLSSQVPFTCLKDPTVMRKVLEGEHPGRPQGVEGVSFTDDLWEMLKLCWSTQPGDRPSIETVLGCLEQVTSTWKPLPPNVGDDSQTDTDDKSSSTRSHPCMFPILFKTSCSPSTALWSRSGSYAGRWPFPSIFAMSPS